MKKKAFYAAEADIPDGDKHFYISRNGRWELNVGDIEGIDELVSPGLKTTNESLKEEKKQAIEKARLAEVAQKAAEDELAKTKKPGTKIVSDAEVKELETYRELGPVADIQRDMETKKELEEKVAQTEAEQSVEKLAGELEMNPEAVKDFVFRTDYGRGIKLGSKKVKEKDTQGKETEKIVATVTIETPDEKDPKKVTSTIKLLSEFLEEKNVPKYLSNALFTKPDDKDDRGKSKESGQRAPKVPVDSTRRSSNGDGGVRDKSELSVAERLNQRRSTRRLPWSPKNDKE